MIIINENFDTLHFTEATLGRPLIVERTITIPVQGLLPMEGHPLMADGVKLLSGSLIFRGVSTSRRVVTEYIGDPKTPVGFKEDYVVDDMLPLDDKNNFFRIYSFEGVLEDPVAWVDWDILAQAFDFVVEKQIELSRFISDSVKK